VFGDLVGNYNPVHFKFGDVSNDLAEATVAEVVNNISKDKFVEQFLETKIVEVSSSRTKQIFS
jgi:hypothetical protein